MRIRLADGVQLDVSPQVNSGSAALQYLMDRMLGYPDWPVAVGALGVPAS